MKTVHIIKKNVKINREKNVEHIFSLKNQNITDTEKYWKIRKLSLIASYNNLFYYYMTLSN